MTTKEIINLIKEEANRSVRNDDFKLMLKQKLSSRGYFSEEEVEEKKRFFLDWNWFPRVAFSSSVLAAILIVSYLSLSIFKPTSDALNKQKVLAKFEERLEAKEGKMEGAEVYHFKEKREFFEYDEDGQKLVDSHVNEVWFDLESGDTRSIIYLEDGEKYGEHLYIGNREYACPDCTEVYETMNNLISEDVGEIMDEVADEDYPEEDYESERDYNNFYDLTNRLRDPNEDSSEVLEELKENKRVKYIGNKEWRGKEVEVLEYTEDHNQDGIADLRDIIYINAETFDFFGTELYGSYVFAREDDSDELEIKLRLEVIEEEYLNEDFDDSIGDLELYDITRPAAQGQVYYVPLSLRERIFSDNLYVVYLEVEDPDNTSISEINEQMIDQICSEGGWMFDYDECTSEVVIRLGDDWYSDYTIAEIMEMVFEAGIDIEDEEWLILSSEDLNILLEEAGLPKLFAYNEYYSYTLDEIQIIYEDEDYQDDVNWGRGDDDTSTSFESSFRMQKVFIDEVLLNVSDQDYYTISSQEVIHDDDYDEDMEFRVVAKFRNDNVHYSYKSIDGRVEIELISKGEYEYVEYQNKWYRNTREENLRILNEEKYLMFDRYDWENDNIGYIGEELLDGNMMHKFMIRFINEENNSEEAGYIWIDIEKKLLIKYQAIEGKNNGLSADFDYETNVVINAPSAYEDVF